MWSRDCVGCRSTAPLELRVAALGEAESGKTTLVGVLTKGALDNGCVQSPISFLSMGLSCRVEG